jgi:hypothetical protein
MWLRIRSICAAGPRIDGARLDGVFGRDAGEVPQDEVARLRVLAEHDPIVDRRADRECVLKDVLQSLKIENLFMVPISMRNRSTS